MHSVIKLKTPQQRFNACLIFAGLLHMVGLMSFHFPKAINVSAPPNTLDLIILPTQNASKKAQPKKQASHQDARQSHAGEALKLAGMNHKSQQSIQAPNKTLRKRTISANHHEPQDAEYLARWQAYIEDYGNNHYPTVAQQENLTGSLRLMVAVNKDGSVQAINLRQSSGVEQLDKAAIQIVQQAAPFEPLPSEISKEVDVLEIIRTWQFQEQFSSNS
jgi:TonB family protein